MASETALRLAHHCWPGALTLVLPLIPYAVAELSDTSGKVVNPGADLWRDVRQRDGSVVGRTQVKGVDSGVLINVT